MNFFETELKKMTAKVSLLKNIKLVGSACIGRLTDTLLVKVEFATTAEAFGDIGIRITVLNRTVGKIDSLLVTFNEIWGQHEGCKVWITLKPAEWYEPFPTAANYNRITKIISDYLENFAD